MRKLNHFKLIKWFVFLFNRPQTEDAWQFANTGITKALGIMAFGNRIYVILNN